MFTSGDWNLLVLQAIRALHSRFLTDFEDILDPPALSPSLYSQLSPIQPPSSSTVERVLSSPASPSGVAGISKGHSASSPLTNSSRRTPSEEPLVVSTACRAIGTACFFLLTETSRISLFVFFRPADGEAVLQTAYLRRIRQQLRECELAFWKMFRPHHIHPLLRLGQGWVK